MNTRKGPIPKCVGCERVVEKFRWSFIGRVCEPCRAELSKVMRYQRAAKKRPSPEPFMPRVVVVHQERS